MPENEAPTWDCHTHTHTPCKVFYYFEETCIATSKYRSSNEAEASECVALQARAMCSTGSSVG